MEIFPSLMAAHVSVLSDLEQPFLCFFQSVLWSWAFVPGPHFYVWWALPDPVTNVHAGLEPQRAIQLFPPEPRPESLMVPQVFQRNPFPRLAAGVRTGAAEQKRLWLPLRPAVSTPKPLVFLLYEPYIVFHPITSECAFAAVSLQITLHSSTYLIWI